MPPFRARPGFFPGVKMADMIKTGAQYLANVLKDCASDNVTITRNGQSATVKATVGNSVFEAEGQNGIIETWESRDFILKTSDLPFGDPQRGDRITEIIAGENCVYEITAPRGTPLFHYADAFQASVRLHTKRID